MIDGVEIVFDDVSDSRPMEQTRSLAFIVKNSNDAITMHNFRGNILTLNRGAKKLYSIPRKRPWR